MTYAPELNVGIPKIGGNFRANKKFMWLDGKTAVFHGTFACQH